METGNFLQQLEFLNKLNEHIENECKKKLEATSDDAYESKDTKEIATALSKAQGEFKPIAFNRENPYFKSGYADFDSIIRAVRPALAKYALSITQQTKISGDGATILSTKLRHASGEWFETRTRIVPAKNDVQSYASTLTYMKRYSAMALLNITTSEDPFDDDAEVAMSPERIMKHKGTSVNMKYDPRSQSSETITTEQREELEYELSEYSDIAEMVLDGLKIQSLIDMPKNKFQASITRIREIKQLREGTGNK